MTDAESELLNNLDGRFRKGLLSGESDTLNKKFTDLDIKTLDYQVDERRTLGHRNVNSVSVYEQGEGTSY